jgi:hypothetical protein
MLVLDTNLCVVSASRAFLSTFRVTPEATEGRLIYELGNGQWDIPALRRLLEEVVPRETEFNGYRVEHDFPGLGRRVMLLNARKLWRPGNHTEMLLLAIEDVTERSDAEDRLRVAYERERRIAVALQRPLTVEVAADAFPGLSVATLYEPARRDEADVGGDFFDAFALPGGRVALAVADASGKGLAAAARAMQVKDVLRAFALEYPHSPAHIVARLNDYVCDSQEDDASGIEGFVCLALAILDPATGDAALVTAGTEPPALFRAGGAATEFLDYPNLPLGVQPRKTFVAQGLRLRPGDTLALFTDGLTEARRGDEFFGPEGVVRAASAALSATPDGGSLPDLRTAAAAILGAARAFAGGSGDDLHDDTCLLLARRREPG